jgi:hypothetical protein
LPVLASASFLAAAVLQARSAAVTYTHTHNTETLEGLRLNTTMH